MNESILILMYIILLGIVILNVACVYQIIKERENKKRMKKLVDDNVVSEDCIGDWWL